MIQYQLIFIFALLLGKTLAYIEPIHIRYSDEQLRELENNPKPIRIDLPRQLIDNQYGAQIYYDEIRPNENQMISKETELQNESNPPNQAYYVEDNYQNRPHQNCENSNNCNTQVPETPSYNYWNYPYNTGSYLSPGTTLNGGINLDYILFVQQYHQYMRDLLYDFHRQRQILLQLINQQKQQLRQLHAQYNQINGAISNTEYQIYQMKLASHHQIPSIKLEKETTGNNQQQPVTSNEHNIKNPVNTAGIQEQKHIEN